MQGQQPPGGSGGGSGGGAVPPSVPAPSSAPGPRPGAGAGWGAGGALSITLWVPFDAPPEFGTAQRLRGPGVKSVFLGSGSMIIVALF